MTRALRLTAIVALALATLGGCDWLFNRTDPSPGNGGQTDDGSGSGGNDTGTQDTTAPGDVTGPSLAPVDGGLAVRWTDPSDADLESVRVSWSAASDPGGSSDVAAGAQSTTITGLTNDTEYTVRLVALDDSANASAGVEITGYPGVDYVALFQADTAVTFPAVRRSVSSAADVDGDGDEDIVIAGQDRDGNRLTRLFLNDGTGNFSVSSADFTGVRTAVVSFGDVDGNGDPDLLVAGDGGGADVATLYLNTGGTFTASTLSIDPLGDAAGGLYDLDGDGDLDILLAGYGSGAFARVWLNGGSGTFGSATNAGLVPTGMPSVDLTDLNNDGDPDLVQTGFDGTDYRTIVYLNDGDGTFTVEQELLGVSGFANFGDMDGDGDADLVLGGSISSSPPQFVGRAYTNAGLGLFVERTSAISDQGFFGMAAFSDVDGDGDTDVVLPNSLSPSSLHVNDGTTFLAPRTSSLPCGEHALFVDVDGDGDEDLLVTGDYGATLLINSR